MQVYHPHGSPTGKDHQLPPMHSRHPLLLGGEEEVELLAVVVHAEEEDAPCISLDNTAGEGEGGKEGMSGVWAEGERMRKRVSAREGKRRGRGGGRGKGRDQYVVCGWSGECVHTYSMWLVYRKGYSKP